MRPQKAGDEQFPGALRVFHGMPGFSLLSEDQWVQGLPGAFRAGAGEEVPLPSFRAGAKGGVFGLDGPEPERPPRKK